MADLELGAVLAQRLTGYRSDLLNAQVYELLNPGVGYHPNSYDLSKTIALIEADDDYRVYVQAEQERQDAEAKAAEEANAPEHVC